MYKRKRNDLSLAQKYEAVQLLDMKLTQTEVSKKLNCSQSQISYISAKREEIRLKWESNENKDRRRQRMGKAADVEQALSVWFDDARAKGVPLSSTILMEASKNIATHLGKPDFNPTIGWLTRWKARNQIRCRRVTGMQNKKDLEAKTPNGEIQDDLPHLLQKYDTKDVFCGVTFELCYRELPKVFQPPESDDQHQYTCRNDRYTTFLCCNICGSDKQELLVIGKSPFPKCFQGKKVLPVRYRSDDNLWMTANIFSDWLKELEEKMKKQKRKILLLADLCSAYVVDNIDDFRFVKVKFLPEDSFTAIQTCIQSIISNLKRHYRKHIVKKLLIELDTDPCIQTPEIAKKINLLESVHLLSKAWRDVQECLIFNCFQKAELLNKKDCPVTTCNILDLDEEKGLCGIISKNGVRKEDLHAFIDGDTKGNSSTNTGTDGNSTNTDDHEDIYAAVWESISSEEVVRAVEDEDSEMEEDSLPVTNIEAKASFMALRKWFEENQCEGFCFNDFYRLEEAFSKFCRQNSVQSS